MDYNEFKERSGLEVTEEQYAIYEQVYLDGPGKAVGSCVGEFIAWIQQNKIAFKTLEKVIAPITSEYADLLKLYRWAQKNNETKAQEIVALEDELAGYRALFTEEEVRARIAERMAGKNLADAVSMMGVKA